MWVKSSTSRSLFSRARERHVFLFEKMVIFSKKTEVISQRRDKKEDNYRYKGHLTVSEISNKCMVTDRQSEVHLIIYIYIFYRYFNLIFVLFVCLLFL